jgi:hypothetical protein
MGGRSHWKCGYCPFGSRQDEFSCEADSVERGVRTFRVGKSSKQVAAAAPSPPEPLNSICPL